MELAVDQVRALEPVERRRAEQLANIFIKAHELLGQKSDELTLDHIREFRDFLVKNGKGFSFVSELVNGFSDQLDANEKMVKAGGALKLHAPDLKKHGGLL